jgi:hypothetical protein
MLDWFKKKSSTGITVLAIGLALLIFTFCSAFWFLNEGLRIIVGQDLGETFGEALVPLITTCVRVMYLGVMGWIGSVITMRGLAILSTVSKSSSPVQQETQTAVAK